MTKKIMSKLLLVLTIMVGVNIFSACEKIDELPPINNNNNASNRAYRQPDPTVSSDREKQEADSIAAEYERGIK